MPEAEKKSEIFDCYTIKYHANGGTRDSIGRVRFQRSRHICALPGTAERAQM